MTFRKIAIIQARMASSRLPGKVLMDIAGKPMLKRVVQRTQRAGTADAVIVATTTEKSDDAIARFCIDEGIGVLRGSHFDVLDRYYKASQQMGAQVVIRITADCPLIDPGLIDSAVGTLLSTPIEEHDAEGGAATAFDLVANRLPPPSKRTYPIGLDTEVCTFTALERAWRESKDPVDREHVMPYLYRGLEFGSRDGDLASGISEHGFRVAVLQHYEDLGNWRWTVDTAEDLEFVRGVFGILGDRGDFSWLEVVQLLRERPELATINAAVAHKRLSEVDQRAPDARGQ